MSKEASERQSLDRLDERLRAAKAQEDVASGRTGRPGRVSASGLGLGIRVGAELVAGLMVGGLIGFGLDSWLHTRPWLSLAFFLLGSVAGMLNAYRAVKGMDDTVGFGAAARRQQQDRVARGDSDGGEPG